MPKRFRLATLLATTALMAVMLAIGSWGIALWRQTIEIERELLLGSNAPVGNREKTHSEVGVHFDIDRAMQADGMSNGEPQRLR